MGSKGSLHFTIGDTESIVKAICAEYEKPDSYLNKDKTHNGFGKPFIVIGDKFISVYDGSFAVYGDIEREAKLLSGKVDAPAMGITNANGDMASFIIANGNDIITEALNADYDWVSKPDIDLLIETMKLTYDSEEVSSLFEGEDADEFISALHEVMEIPYFLYNDETLRKYMEVEEDLPQITIYRQTKPYQWDNSFDYII